MKREVSGGRGIAQRAERGAGPGVERRDGQGAMPGVERRDGLGAMPGDERRDGLGDGRVVGQGGRRGFGRAVWLAVALFGAWRCGLAAAPAESELDVIRGAGRADGFARAIEPRAFAFPADHGPHQAFRHEWWYVTGNLDSAAGERFGFELTFFRFALAPLGNGMAGGGAPGVAGGGAPGVAGGGSVGVIGAGASAWRTRQVYAAHFAITDVSRGEFRFAQKRARDALGLAGAEAQPFHVWLDDWSIGGDSKWTLHAAGRGYELTLDAEPQSAPVLNGDHGLSRKSSEIGAASYYYSIPRIAVHGKIVRAGTTADVHGLAWLDREWGSGSLGTSQQGWDWFALQLQDGSALMFYSLRNRDGSRDSHSAGTWVDPAGRSQALSTDQVTIDVGDHWTSPRGGRYPSRWRVRIPSVGLDVEIHPVLADQELATKPRYWEGAVDVRGTNDGHAAGRGYVELVGYGE